MTEKLDKMSDSSLNNMNYSNLQKPGIAWPMVTIVVIKDFLFFFYYATPAVLYHG